LLDGRKIGNVPTDGLDCLDNSDAAKCRAKAQKWRKTANRATDEHLRRDWHHMADRWVPPARRRSEKREPCLQYESSLPLGDERKLLDELYDLVHLASALKSTSLFKNDRSAAYEFGPPRKPICPSGRMSTSAPRSAL
jgi:hypothetical protein